MFHIKEKINNGDIYIIAEMSANHGGKIENALEIVRAAKRAGADCLKTQTYTADTITIDSDGVDFKIKGGLWDGYKYYDLYKEAYTPWEWMPVLKKECDKLGLDFLSTPFDNTAIDYLESIGEEAYKIASYELVDIPLIEYAASKMKPMIMSCGMANEEEINDAVEACKRQNNNDIYLLKCCSNYPSDYSDMYVSTISDMKRKFQLPVGLSDHSFGYLADVTAIGAGACIIEKHICINREIQSADMGFSMTVEEFAEMVKNVRAAALIMGNVRYGCLESENIGGRRSLYAIKDIAVNEKFSEENVKSIRPGYGLKPKYYSQLMGLTSKRNIKRGERITEDDLYQV